MRVPGRDTGSYLRAALDAHKLLSTGVESPQTLEIASILVQAKSSVNSTGDDGRTPLHTAIQHHELMSPMVARLLVSARADLNARDLSQKSPVAYLREQADPPSCAVRQLLDEVTTQPTVAVGVVEDEQVLGVCFADTKNSKVGFFTPTSVGLFDVTQRQIIAKMKLTQKRVLSTVRGMTINPELGTIAVFLEAANAKSTDTNAVTSLIMVWPSGQIRDGEEPLKLSCDSAGRADATSSQLHPTILGSTSAAPIKLLSRTYSGQVYCWRLQAACAQIVSQCLITESGGLLALSECGTWFAAVNLAEQGKPNLEVWTFTGKVPEKVTTLDKRPQTMSIIGLNDGSGCAHVAMAEEAAPGQPPVPIEILRIEATGAMGSVSVVQMESPCRMLSFLQPNRILSGHGDGAVVVTDCSTSESSMAYDDHAMRTVSASADQTMIVTAVGNSIRVFQMAELPAGHAPHAARAH
jgi:hypothetical protein